MTSKWKIEPRLAIRLTIGADALAAPFSETYCEDGSVMTAEQAVRMARGDLDDMQDRLANAASRLMMSDVEAERERALTILRLLAEEGNATAVFNFALELVRGVHVPRDLVRAERMLLSLKCSAQETPVLLAMVRCQLSKLHELRGEMKEALRLLEEEAPNYPQAAFDAARIHEKEYAAFGIERDLKRAVHFYRIAIKAGDIKAMTNLGYLLAREEDYRHLLDEGWDLLRAASAAGDRMADTLMARLASGI